MTTWNVLCSSFIIIVPLPPPSCMRLLQSRRCKSQHSTEVPAITVLHCSKSRPPVHHQVCTARCKGGGQLGANLGLIDEAWTVSAAPAKPEKYFGFSGFTLRARAAVSWWANQDQERGEITDFAAWSLAHNDLVKNFAEHLWCQKEGYAKDERKQC